MRYRVLETRIKTATSHREKLMHKIESVLNDRLADEGVWPERVAGRQKRVFSIYKKMKNKRLPFSEIMDVYAFRIIARDRRQCYSLLGVVHEIFTPVPGRFKDYIAIPKANGYQSLHTILFGPNGVPLEIQIRTQEMDETSEQGIAAHWAYKNEARVSPTEVKARAWLKNLLDMQEETSNSAEFLENVKIDLFPDEVYVFTPRGDIRELPLNATAIDFAYMIHTDLGNRCVAAKVNRRLVPLNQVLQNGQAVEIMTSPTAVPSPAWLNFAVTGKAKSGIRQYLKSQEKVESAELGRKLFEYALGEHKIDWKKIAKAKKQTFLRKLKLKTEKSLFETLGVGELSSLTVVRRLSEVLSGESAQDNDDSKANALAIVGSEGATLTYATCCRPIPGDDIRGVLGKSGMKVHVSNCRKLTKMDFSKNEDYMMFVSWSPNVKGVFIAEICVALKNVSGALAHLATAISDAGSSIHKIQTDEMDPAYGLVELLVEVQNRDHLATLLRRLKSMRMILRAHRVNHRI
jgi:RelA/SpoT family (p)ppGpp synthetase